MQLPHGFGKRDDWKPSSPPIAAESFEDTLREHSAVVVHFWANWDKSGRVMDAWLQEVRPSVSDILTFYSIDVDSEAHQEIVARCGIQTTPWLIFFLNGKVRGYLIGIRPVPELDLQLQQWRGAVEVSKPG